MIWGRCPMTSGSDLHAGYDSAKTREELVGRGMTRDIARKGDKARIFAALTDTEGVVAWSRRGLSTPVAGRAVPALSTGLPAVPAAFSSPGGADQSCALAADQHVPGPGLGVVRCPDELVPALEDDLRRDPRSACGLPAVLAAAGAVALGVAVSYMTRAAAALAAGAGTLPLLVPGLRLRGVYRWWTAAKAARSACRFCAVWRLLPPIAAAICAQVAPLSRAASISASSPRSSSAPRWRTPARSS